MWSLTFSEENMREVIPCDPACHDSPTSNPELNAEPGLSTRFLSKAHRRKKNAKGRQTEQHPRRVGEVREKGSCNLSVLACQCGQDDSAPHKDSYLDMHNAICFIWRTNFLPFPPPIRFEKGISSLQCTQCQPQWKVPVWKEITQGVWLAAENIKHGL